MTDRSDQTKDETLKIDPELRPVLDNLKIFDGNPVHLMTPQQLRALQKEGEISAPRPPGIRVEDGSVRTASNEVPIRIYRPTKQGVRSAMLYIHGGGWVTGSLESHDAICAKFSADAGIVVVALDYRLSPETRYPGALYDCTAIADWLFENCSELSVDPMRVAIGGDSAGGNLSAALCLKMRDQNHRFRFALQMLFYPVTDNDVDNSSYIRNRAVPLLDRDIMIWVLNHYLGSDWRNVEDPYALPLKAQTLRDLPPAYIATAELDPLLDEGANYASRLILDGVACEYRVAPQMIHGFLRFPAFSATADREFRCAVDALTRHLQG